MPKNFPRHMYVGHIQKVLEAHMNILVIVKVLVLFVLSNDHIGPLAMMSKVCMYSMVVCFFGFL